MKDYDYVNLSDGTEYRAGILIDERMLFGVKAFVRKAVVVNGPDAEKIERLYVFYPTVGDAVAALEGIYAKSEAEGVQKCLAFYKEKLASLRDETEEVQSWINDLSRIAIDWKFIDKRFTKVD